MGHQLLSRGPLKTVCLPVQTFCQGLLQTNTSIMATPFCQGLLQTHLTFSVCQGNLLSRPLANKHIYHVSWLPFFLFVKETFCQGLLQANTSTICHGYLFSFCQGDLVKASCKQRHLPCMARLFCEGASAQVVSHLPALYLADAFACSFLMDSLNDLLVVDASFLGHFHQKH